MWIRASLRKISLLLKRKYSGFVCLYYCCIYDIQPVWRGCCSHRKKGSRHWSWNHQPITNDFGGRKVCLPRGFFFSMKKFKGKSFTHTQERSIFYCYIVWQPQCLFPSSNSAGKGRIVYLLAVSSLSKAWNFHFEMALKKTFHLGTSFKIFIF